MAAGKVAGHMFSPSGPFSKSSTPLFHPLPHSNICFCRSRLKWKERHSMLPVTGGDTEAPRSLSINSCLHGDDTSRGTPVQEQQKGIQSVTVLLEQH